jgi:hypothetical protein
MVPPATSAAIASTPASTFSQTIKLISCAASGPPRAIFTNRCPTTLFTSNANIVASYPGKLIPLPQGARRCDIQAFGVAKVPGSWAKRWTFASKVVVLPLLRGCRTTSSLPPIQAISPARSRVRFASTAGGASTRETASWPTTADHVIWYLDKSGDVVLKKQQPPGARNNPGKLGLQPCE